MRVVLHRPDLSEAGPSESGPSTLGARWRALEARAEPTPFQTWTWVGCQAAARYDDPRLLEATAADGTTVALALFNRRRRLWLHETGDPALDAPFIERNGLLVASGHADALPALLRALPAGLVLSGIDDELAAASATGRAVVAAQERMAPVLDLAGPVLDRLSANTRAQLRRAMRRYGEAGPIIVTRAADPAAARSVLAELIVLHQARWQARGRPGAFADPGVVAFHHALIGRGVARGEVDLLRVAAGGETIGLLYNLRSGGRVFAYQAGFAYPAAGPAAAQLKPGMVCHAAAAEWYRAQGAASYDFGAGESRYKRSLATRMDRMHWLTLAAPWSAPAVLARVRRMVRQGRRSPRAG